jgi:hypothetical protein
MLLNLHSRQVSRDTLNSSGNLILAFSVKNLLFKQGLCHLTNTVNIMLSDNSSYSQLILLNKIFYLHLLAQLRVRTTEDILAS